MENCPLGERPGKVDESAMRSEPTNQMKRHVIANAFRLLVALVLVLAAGFPTLAQTNSALPAEALAKIETAISSFMSRQNVPGLTVAIVQDNQIRFVGAYGISDLENFVPTKTTTVFRIASVSKPITAVAAMQLVERGKLDFDAPVQKYVPGFPVKQFAITTRQLLGHLSGVRYYRRGEGERTVRYNTLTDALDIFKDDPLENEPGTRFLYTTYGYTLLGAVIEGASGMSFEEYMRENVFKPAGMTRTRLDDIFAIIPNRARGYTPRVFAVLDGNYRNPVLMDSSYKYPGGGFVSSAEDMGRFAIAVMNGTLIKPETFAEMSKSQKTRDGRDTGYGYGWYVGRAPGFAGDPEAVSHGGVQPGFTSNLVLLPKKKFAVIVLTNLEAGGRLDLASLVKQLTDIMLQ
jgi:serine beta-lactamase-like protein LACTB, mitochondrial